MEVLIMSDLDYDGILSILTKRLKSEYSIKVPLDEKSDVLNLGLDSLDVMNYLFFLEETFQVNIADDQIQKDGILVLENTARLILENSFSS